MATEAPDRPAGDLRLHAARGTLINAAFLVGLSTLGFVRGFVVARFISRADYGIWGLIVVGLGTLGWLLEAGVRDKYIQQEESDQVLAYQRAFSVEAVRAGAFALLLLVAAPILVLVTGEAKLLWPALATIAVVPATVLQAPLWILYRRMDFARQRALEAIAPVVSFVVTIALAVAGAGYWSFVAGLLAGAYLTGVVAWRLSPIPAAWRLDRASLRDYVSFSWPLVLAGAGGILIAQGSVLLAQGTAGLAGAGVIALATSITVQAQRVDDVLTSALYPAVCAVSDRIELMRETFLKSNRLALMWGFPFGLGVALFAGDIVTYLLGEHWRPAVGLLQAFGLIAGVNQIAFNWSAYVRARGDTRPIAVVSALTAVAWAVIAAPALLLGGLKGFGWGMGGMTAVALVARSFYVARMLGNVRILVHAARALAPSVPAAGVVLAGRALESGPRTAALAAGECAAYVLITAAATIALEGPLLREALGYLRGRRPAALGA